MAKTTQYAVSLIFVTACLLYWPIVYHSYVDYDDYQLFVENTAVRSLNLGEIFGSFAAGTYVPLTLLSAALEYRLLGTDPFYFHLFDLLLHAINGALVFLVFSRLGLRVQHALLLAVIFVVHPLRVESVAWASARKDTLSSMLALVAMLAYQVATTSTSRRHTFYYAAAVGTFILACLAKPAAVVLPLIWLGWDLYLNKLSFFEALRNKLPYLAVSLGLGYINLKAQLTADILAAHPNYWHSITHALPLSISFYLAKFAAPLNLSILYPASYFADKVWFYLLALAVLTLALAGLLSAHRKRQALFCWLWFLSSLALVLKIIPFGSEESWVHDRFLYFPSIGLAGACIFGLQEIGRRWVPKPLFGKVSLLAVGAWILWLTTLTHQQIKVWQSTETLWRQVLARYPELPHSYRALATELMVQGRFKEAPVLLKRAYELESHPGKRLDLLSSLAISFSQIGELEKSLNLFEKLLAERPEFDSKVNYAVTLFLAKRSSEARPILEAAMRERPLDPRPPYNLALIALQDGDLSHAKRLLQTALDCDPHFEPAQAKLQSFAQPQ